MSEVNTTPLGAFLLGQQLRRNLAAVREQWETLFEGEVQSEENSNGGYSASLTISCVYELDGQKVKLTLNGDSRIYTVILNNNLYYAGNMFLASSDNPDDGFGVVVVSSKILNTNRTNFYFRESGSHSVKIESVVV